MKLQDVRQLTAEQATAKQFCDAEGCMNTPVYDAALVPHDAFLDIRFFVAVCPACYGALQEGRR